MKMQVRPRWWVGWEDEDALGSPAFALASSEFAELLPLVQVPT